MLWSDDDELLPELEMRFASNAAALADVYASSLQKMSECAMHQILAVSMPPTTKAAVANARKLVSVLRDQTVAGTKTFRDEHAAAQESVIRALRAELHLAQKEIQRLTVVARRQGEELAHAITRSRQLEGLVLEAAHALRENEQQQKSLSHPNRAEVLNCSSPIRTADAGTNTTHNLALQEDGIATSVAQLLVASHRSSQALVLDARRLVLVNMPIIRVTQLSCDPVALPTKQAELEESDTVIGLHHELAEALRQLAAERAERIDEAATKSVKIASVASVATQTTVLENMTKLSSTEKLPIVNSSVTHKFDLLLAEEDNVSLREENKKLIAMIRVLTQTSSARKGATVATADKDTQAIGDLELLRRLSTVSSTGSQTVASSTTDLVALARQEEAERAYAHLQRLETALYNATTADDVRLPATGQASLVKGIVEEMASMHRLLVGKENR